MSPRWIGVAALCALGCASAPGSQGATVGAGELSVAQNTNAPPPARPAQSEPPSAGAGQGRWAGRSGTGISPEDPVSACGPGDSNAFVAGEFQCPEGGNPLGGDPMAGAQSRLGNVGVNSTGHIIDHYRVPCASGAVDVYIDMYGCPEMDSGFQE